MAGPDEPTDAEKVPVTIVTGFLGSGKTTLVNYILQGEHGKKIAVIENEFGEVNIDEALVTENMQYKEDVISMDNGCGGDRPAALVGHH
jgi:G3E family GTPase